MQDSDTRLEDRDQCVNTARRRTIMGAMGVVVFLPERWTAPVLETVVLPAHAQTSPGDSPPAQSLFSFQSCSVALQFELLQFFPDSTSVIPMVTGSISGSGDLSGVTVNIVSILTLNGSPFSIPQSISGTTTTDAGGNFQLDLDGLAPPDGVGGPHIISNVSNCDASYANGVEVTITSSDSRLPGETTCTASYTCGDLQSVQP